MPITVITTAGDANANSYVSVAEADAYFDLRLYATSWTGVSSNDTKARALISATRRVDQVAFDGYRASAAQALQWPRTESYDYEREEYLLDNTVPQRIKDAVCELALNMLTAAADPSATDALSKFSALSLPGGLSLTLRDGSTANDSLPPVVLRLLTPFMSGNGVTFLERS